MDNHSRKLLFDVVEAGRSIRTWQAQRNFADYQSDRLLRRATEREFEIIGEALARLAKHAPDVADQIPEVTRIVAFRNRIIHGYDAIDDATVWGVAQDHLPALLAVVEKLLGDGWTDRI
ncbi:MAG: DUF86 domain-containing protein [Leptospirales bacterium]|nr:DUF86 domain-containing protein [Leptospirales bacterium]